MTKWSSGDVSCRRASKVKRRKRKMQKTLVGRFSIMAAVRQYEDAKNKGGVASMRHEQMQDACIVRYVDLMLR